MVTLSELLGAGVKPGSVMVCGKMVAVRMLTAAETMAIGKLEPQPSLKLAPGSEPPPDADRILEPMRRERESALKCLEAAAAIGYKTKSGHTYEPRRPTAAWASEAKAELLENLSEEQIYAVWTASKKIAMTDLMGQAQGNSSSPAGSAPPAG